MHKEELRSRGIGHHRPRHGKHTLSMLKVVGKAVRCKLSLNRIIRAAHSSPLRVSALKHKALYDTMKCQSVVKTLIYKRDKIVDGIRCYLRVKLRLHNIAVLHRKSYYWFFSHLCSPYASISYSLFFLSSSGSIAPLRTL